MPIILKDYTWKQTDKKVIVKVPLKGVQIDKSKADIFTCDNFIKVHCPPYLFEVCLRDIINEDNSICRISNNEIVFELEKNEEVHWDVLEAPLTKSEILAVKQRAIDLSQEKCKIKKDKISAFKEAIKKQAVHDQITLDTKERNKIDNLKEDTKKVAMNELEQWKRNQSIQDKKEIFDKCDRENLKAITGSTFSTKNLIVSSSEKSENVKEVACSRNIKKMTVSKDKEIFNTSEKYQKRSFNNNNNIKKENIVKNLPPPRNNGRIGVNFTPRAFPTPSRESKLEEENEWLRKQAEARRRAGFNIEDLRPEEHDPVWLKDKGDSFYKVGNYIGAISAYSHAIKLNPDIPALYSNRAAAHLAEGNLRRVVQDTTKALELLVPCIEMNASSRSLCHARRGSALCQLNLLEAGLADLEEALKLNPENKELENDMRIVKETLQNQSEKDDEGDETEDDETESNIMGID